MELVRPGHSRRVYTQNHIDYVVETFPRTGTRKERAHGYRVPMSRPFRHFTYEV